MGMTVDRIRAGHANMFLSPLFRQTLASITQAPIELYDTDGAAGAARGAGIGANIYKDSEAAFASLEKVADIEPDTANLQAYEDAYGRWKRILDNLQAC